MHHCKTRVLTSNATQFALGVNSFCTGTLVWHFTQASRRNIPRQKSIQYLEQSPNGFPHPNFCTFPPQVKSAQKVRLYCFQFGIQARHRLSGWALAVIGSLVMESPSGCWSLGWNRPKGGGCRNAPSCTGGCGKTETHRDRCNGLEA